MDLAHRLRMPLLFVIAGAGMWFALQRRTGDALIGERTLRLLVPAIVGMFLIVPPQVFVERIAHGQWSRRLSRFHDPARVPVPALPGRRFQLASPVVHHLSIRLRAAAPAAAAVVARAQPALRPGVWMYALALPLGINEALLKPLFPESHNLVSDWYIFNPLPAAHDLRIRAGVDARRLGLAREAPALVARARPRGVARRCWRSSKPASSLATRRRTPCSPTSSPGSGCWCSSATAAST